MPRKKLNKERSLLLANVHKKNKASQLLIDHNKRVHRKHKAMRKERIRINNENNSVNLKMYLHRLFKSDSAGKEIK